MIYQPRLSLMVFSWWLTILFKDISLHVQAWCNSEFSHHCFAVRNDQTGSCARNVFRTHLRLNTEDYNEGSDDWRDVRAKLIQQYRLESASSSLKIEARIGLNTTTAVVVNTTTAIVPDVITSTGWAYDSGDAIEVGSLIVSRPVQDFACGGLKQQYLHKCVVLVVHNDPAFTKGVILNRPINEKGSIKIRDKANNEWNAWFAGEVAGITSPSPAFTCLHRLKSPKAKEWSTPIVKDIQSISWELAQVLVEKGEATPEDFWLGCGYAGWGPNQLMNELDRKNWFVVATDSKSILKSLGNEAADDKNGTGMWQKYMQRIGKRDLLEKYSTKQSFEDLMLGKWSRQQCVSSKVEEIFKMSRKGDSDKSNESVEVNSAKDNHTTGIQAGSVFRASAPIIFDEQVFHESVVLIMQVDDRGVVGLILNRPTTEASELHGHDFPIRFGGHYGLQGEGQPETWLHCEHDTLQEAKVGEPVSPKGDSLFWRCTREDAEIAIRMGMAVPSDFLVFRGLTLWENVPPEGLGTPLTKTRLDKSFKLVEHGAIPALWKELVQQEPLTESNFADNIKRSRQAFQIGCGNIESPSCKLADEALERWIKLFTMNKMNLEDS